MVPVLAELLCPPLLFDPLRLVLTNLPLDRFEVLPLFCHSVFAVLFFSDELVLMVLVDFL